MSENTKLREALQELYDLAKEEWDHFSEVNCAGSKAISKACQALALPTATPAVPQGWVEQMLTDARHVFDAGGPETPQETRDVIEYVASWIAAYRDKFSATKSTAPAQERCHLCDCTGDIHDATGEGRGECLYCKPAQEVGLTDEERQQVFKAAESHMEREPNLSWRNAVVDEVIAALRAKGASDA